MPHSIAFVAGKRFGHWTTVRDHLGHSGGRDRRMWLCRCDCGEERDIDPSALLRGQTTQCRSCGNRQKAALKSRLTHGQSNTRLHGIWMLMRRRCADPNNADYHRYGGRGITVCEEWQSFEPFYDWATCNGYTSDLTLDREDNDRGYGPENCRWVTRTVQNRNRRDNVRYQFRGQNLTIPEISEIVGIHASALRLRVIRYGMSIEEAATKPLRRRAVKGVSECTL